MPLVQRKSSELLTINRASPGAYFDQSGVLRQAIANRLRRSFDPVTHAFQGILIEESRTNLIKASSALDDATWSGTNMTVNANIASAPDGTTTADKMISSVATSVTHSVGLQSSGSVAVTTGVAVTYSAFVKAAELTFCLLSFDSADSTTPWGATPGSWFNLSTGTVISVIGTVSNATITALSNGWFRVSMTAVPVASGPVRPRIIPANAASPTFAANVGDGLYAWGVQVEIGASMTSFIPTISAAVTRAADVVGMPVDLKLTRSNILAPSNDFTGWTAGTGVTLSPASIPGPSGLASSAVMPSGFGLTVATPVLSSLLSAYTFSVFVKASAGLVQLKLSGAAYTAPRTATFDLAALSVTSTTDEAAIGAPLNGWVRISITATPNVASAVGSLAILNNGTSSLTIGLFGAQLESFPQATAYMPTTSAATSATSYFNWYDMIKGTLVGSMTSSPGACLLSLDDGTNSITISQDATGLVSLTITSAGIVQVILTGSVVAAGLPLGIAACWSYDTNSIDVSLGVNGTVFTDSPFTRLVFVDPVSLRLGNFGGTTSFINSYIRRVQYFKTALPSQIAALSSES
jgi:hypothetical protein